MGNCQQFNNVESPTRATFKPSKSYLIVKTSTWTRDSHGLYDYESKNIVKSEFKISTAGTLLRDINNETKFYPNIESQKQAPIELPLCNILENFSNYIISTPFGSDEKTLNPNFQEGIDENSIWSIVKVKNNKNQKENKSSMKSNVLEEGNIIKFGRVRFRIQSISHSLDDFRAKKDKFNNSNFNSALEKSLDIDPKIESIQSESETTRICRFCLFEQADYDDPLINPCTCTGSMKYIHINCLRKWLNSKLQNKKSDFMNSLTWKSLECELCKKQYQYDLIFKGKRFTLVDIPEPEEYPQLQLELLGRDNNSVKGVYQISMAKKKLIKIGRGHDSDIRITDISVSRCHAIMKYEKQSLTIEDNGSKFGTLLLLNEPFQFDFNKNSCLNLQINRTVVNFKMKKIWKMLAICHGDKPGNPSQSNIIMPSMWDRKGTAYNSGDYTNRIHDALHNQNS